MARMQQPTFTPPVAPVAAVSFGRTAADIRVFPRLGDAKPLKGVERTLNGLILVLGRACPSVARPRSPPAAPHCRRRRRRPRGGAFSVVTAYRAVTQRLRRAPAG